MDHKTRVLIVRRRYWDGRHQGDSVIASIEVGKLKDEGSFISNFRMPLDGYLFIERTGEWENLDEIGNPFKYCHATVLSDYMEKQTDLTMEQILLKGMLRAASSAEAGKEDRIIAVLYQYYG